MITAMTSPAKMFSIITPNMAITDRKKSVGLMWKNRACSLTSSTDRTASRMMIPNTHRGR